jgi:nitroimidazol reductase NimA-like FMN-containing flavoprotein (pyridoxamine 5'-phosphate oxidase superfamily)
MDDLDPHSWVEHLGADECWRRLDAEPVGRVGIVYDSAPEIYPVNHAVVDGTVVFRVDPGRVLAGVSRTPLVSFEIDGIDTAGQSGWSVLVKGRAAEVEGADELARMARLPLRRWALGAKTHWVRITPVEVTGRRIGHGRDDAPPT